MTALPGGRAEAAPRVVVQLAKDALGGRLDLVRLRRGCSVFLIGGGLGRLAMARFRAVSAASRYFSIRNEEVCSASPTLSKPLAEPSGGQQVLQIDVDAQQIADGVLVLDPVEPPQDDPPFRDPPGGGRFHLLAGPVGEGLKVFPRRPRLRLPAASRPP